MLLCKPLPGLENAIRGPAWLIVTGMPSLPKRKREGSVKHPPATMTTTAGCEGRSGTVPTAETDACITCPNPCVRSCRAALGWRITVAGFGYSSASSEERAVSLVIQQLVLRLQHYKPTRRSPYSRPPPQALIRRSAMEFTL